MLRFLVTMARGGNNQGKVHGGTSLLADGNYLSDIVGIIDDYLAFRMIADKHKLSVRDLLRFSVGRYDREYIGDQEIADLQFHVPESGLLDFNSAKLLHKRLSAFFAKFGHSLKTPAEKKERGNRGATKRWNKLKAQSQ